RGVQGDRTIEPNRAATADRAAPQSANGRTNGPGRGHRVRVDEEEQVSCGRPGSDIPRCRDLPVVDSDNACTLFARNLGGAVRGGIVDDDDLVSFVLRL